MPNLTSCDKYNDMVNMIENYLSLDNERHPTVARISFHPGNPGYLCEIVAEQTTYWMKILIFPKQQYLIIEIIPSIMIPKCFLARYIEKFNNTLYSENQHILLYPSYDAQRLSLKSGLSYSIKMPDVFDLLRLENNLIEASKNIIRSINHEWPKL